MKGLVLSLLLVLATANAEASSRFIYDLDGTQQNIAVCDTMIAVKFAPGAKGLSTTFALQYDALRDNNTAYEKPTEFFAYVVTPGHSIDSLLAAIRVNPAVDLAQPTVQWDSQIVYVYDHLLVKPKAGVSSDSMLALFQSLGLTFLEAPTSLRAGYSVTLSESSAPDIFDAANQLYATGACEYSMPNFSEVIRREFFPNDLYFQQYYQWYLYQPGEQLKDIDMDVAWDMVRHKGDSSIVIAFIDGAFDLDHTDLNQTKIYLPYDVAGDEYSRPLVPDFDPRLPTNGLENYEFYWHGTPCLGIMSAMLNNTRGIAGIAPQFRFMPIKDSDDNFVNSAETVEAAWRWAFINDAEVIASSSTTFNFNYNIAQMIQEAYEAGKVIINAAGNGGNIVKFPANLPEVIAVGFTDQGDNRHLQSNAGPELDLVAPGVDIFALDITGANGYPSTDGNCVGDQDYYCWFGGTSASAPQVAAVAALVLSRMLPSIRDTASTELIYGILRESSEDEIAPNDIEGWDYLYGWGRLNAARALLAVVRGDADNDGIISITDVVYLNKFIFGGGPAPIPHLLTGDADCNGIITISDSVWLITYVFGGGPPPRVCLTY